MKIKKTKIEEDFNRDIFWTKIIIQSNDNKKTSVILICASWEYLCDFNKVNRVKKYHIELWLDGALKEIEKNKKVFSKKVHYIVNANTEGGKKNGLKFLKEKAI